MPRYRESTRNLSLEQIAYREGFDVGWYSQDWTEAENCPYTGYRLATAWEDGFHAGRDDRRDYGTDDRDLEGR